MTRTAQHARLLDAAAADLIEAEFRANVRMPVYTYHRVPARDCRQESSGCGRGRPAPQEPSRSQFPRLIRAADAFGRLFPIYVGGWAGVYTLCFLADVIAQATS